MKTDSLSSTTATRACSGCERLVRSGRVTEIRVALRLAAADDDRVLAQGVRDAGLAAERGVGEVAVDVERHADVGAAEAGVRAAVGVAERAAELAEVEGALVLGAV